LQQDKDRQGPIKPTTVLAGLLDNHNVSLIKPKGLERKLVRA
jgi:hypothetical protein